MCDRSHLSREDLDAIEAMKEFRDIHGRLPRHRAEFVSWAADQYSKFLKAKLHRQRSPRRGEKMFVTFDAGMVDLSSPDRATLAGITIEGPGVGSEIKDLLEREALRILKKHGTCAFESTKKAAAVHEAGHTVVAHLNGKRPKRVRIKQHRANGTTVWLGLTESYKRPKLDTVAQQLKEARFIYAGIAAEMLFDADLREASSIDEIIMSQCVAEIARTLNVDPETYWRAEVCAGVERLLRENHATVARIADHLFQHHQLRQPALGRLLQE